MSPHGYDDEDEDDDVWRRPDWAKNPDWVEPYWVKNPEWIESDEFHGVDTVDRIENPLDDYDSFIKMPDNQEEGFSPQDEVDERLETEQQDDALGPDPRIWAELYAELTMYDGGTDIAIRYITENGSPVNELYAVACEGSSTFRKSYQRIIREH